MPMKKSNLSIEQSGLEYRLDLNIQAILACCTGTAPGMLMPEFVSIWKQMLPESNFTLPLLEEPAKVARRQSNTAKNHYQTTPEGNIREGPD